MHSTYRQYWKEELKMIMQAQFVECMKDNEENNQITTQTMPKKIESNKKIRKKKSYITDRQKLKTKHHNKTSKKPNIIDRKSANIRKKQKSIPTNKFSNKFDSSSDDDSRERERGNCL